MYAVFTAKDQKLLLNGKWGIEREAQRVTPKGDLALTPHPAAFGDKLRNKEITTDFSESQMELITPALPTVEEVDQYLKYLYKTAISELQNEFLWPLSMPPKLPSEELIPIARFDESEEGQMSFRYRHGLANRYGKKMQMISGIHFNFSYGNELLQLLWQEFKDKEELIEFTDAMYFSVARNFLRYRWLIIYLFGAAPSFDDTYDAVLKQEVENIRKCCPECCCNYANYATSLRVSRYGYNNPVQSGYSSYYNSKEEYVHGIRRLMSIKSRKYAKLDYQLNDKILQKDSEFYSPIRLKQITGPGESQVDAIDERGVKYAEVRILDINPYEPSGISLEQMHFLQVFMLFCLFEENRAIDQREMSLITKNHNLVALSGRKPKLKLNNLSGGKISLRQWGESIFYKLHKIAELLDQENSGKIYCQSVQEEYRKLEDLSLLPSAVMQEEMNSGKESFIDYGIRKAKEYHENQERSE